MTLRKSIVALAAAVTGALTVLSTQGCELAVHLDLGLVDAGESPCTICLDDADTVILDDAGNQEIVPKDSAAARAFFADGAEGADVPDGSDEERDR